MRLWYAVELICALVFFTLLVTYLFDSNIDGRLFLSALAIAGFAYANDKAES